MVTNCCVAQCPQTPRKVCGYPFATGNTCDALLCDSHAHRGPAARWMQRTGELDYCPDHFKMVQAERPEGATQVKGL